MAVSFGMLSTYPPTQCGLATFSQALTTHLVGSGADVGIVRVVDCPQPAQRRVVHELVIGQRAGARAAAGALNQYDVAIIQHEYGIFGGRDGADVLDVLRDRCHAPRPRRPLDRARPSRCSRRPRTSGRATSRTSSTRAAR